MIISQIFLEWEMFQTEAVDYIKAPKNKILLDATYYFIMLTLGSTCFGHHYAHHQELTTIALVTT